MHGLEISFKKQQPRQTTRVLQNKISRRRMFLYHIHKNSNFIKYCSYRDPQGSIIGDPVYREYTRHPTRRHAGRTSELERNTS